MVKPSNPYKPFNDAAQSIEPEPSQLKDPLELNPPRDKDNAAYTPKPPSWGIAGTARQAPPGGMGYRAPLEQPSKPKPEIDITKGDPDKDLWIHGKITSMDGYTFSVKNYDLPSEHGINNGTISKLQIKDGNRIAASFDRGWDIKPITHQDRDALNKVRKAFDPPKDFKPIVPKSNDKDHGHER